MTGLQEFARELERIAGELYPQYEWRFAVGQDDGPTGGDDPGAALDDPDALLDRGTTATTTPRATGAPNDNSFDEAA